MFAPDFTGVGVGRRLVFSVVFSSAFILYRLAILLSVLRFTAYYTYLMGLGIGIFKMFLLSQRKEQMIDIVRIFFLLCNGSQMTTPRYHRRLIVPASCLSVKPLIHQLELRTYTKVVPFQEKSYFHFVVLWLNR